MAALLGAVSSRFLKAPDDDGEDFSQEVSAEDQRWVMQRCEEFDEWDDDVLSFWIRKIKKEERKRVKRLIVITKHRVFSVAKSGKHMSVKRHSHLMDLVKVAEMGLVLQLEFRGFKLSFQVGEDTDMLRLLSQLYMNYTNINPGFPPSMACQWLDQYGTSQEKTLKKKVPVRTQEFAIWERPLNSFTSYCSFYGVDKRKYHGAMRSALSRELLDKHDERWLRCPDLGITHPRVVAGLMVSLSFTEKLVHGIEVGGFKGDAYMFDSIVLFLRNNATIKHLVIDGCCATPEWGALLFASMRENTKTQLQTFAIRNAEFGDKGLHNYILGLKKLPRHPPNLALTNVGGSSFKNMETLLQAFVGRVEVGKGLVELDLSHNAMGKKGTEVLASRLSKGELPDLRALRLRKCALSVPKLLTGIEVAQRKGALQLAELSISQNKMSEADALILSRIIANAGSMAHLEVAYCTLTGSVVAALVASLLLNEGLEYYVQFDCSGNALGVDGAIMVASIINSTAQVMSVKLNDCGATHEGVGYLLRALEHQPRLRVLQLDDNVKRSEWDSGKHLVSQCLRSLVEKAYILETVSLRSDAERGFQYDLDHFLYALKTNTNIVSVDITGNRMTTENMSELRDVVIRNEVLQRLFWDDNNITERHISMFIHALKQNKALQLVEFPERDFKRLLKAAGKDKRKTMELQLLKKNFYQALFDNSQASGFAFDSGALAVKRTQAKRFSIVPKSGRRKLPAMAAADSDGPVSMDPAEALASMAQYGGTRIAF